MNIQTPQQNLHNMNFAGLRKQQNKPEFVQHPSEDNKNFSSLTNVGAGVLLTGAILLGIKFKVFKTLGEYLKDGFREIFSRKEQNNTIKTFYNQSKNKQGIKPMKKGLKEYINGLKTGENIDPIEIEKILLKSGAEDVTIREGIEFLPTAKFPSGKKKKFLLEGKEYYLETHNGEGSMDTVTRLWESGSKNERNYLNANGTFSNDSYFSSFTHLFSGMKGVNWIKSK
jgi:hypothetical protein